MLVLEIKTELRDLGELERQLSRYEAHAREIARQRGWRPTRTMSAVLLLASDTNETRILALRGSLASAFPVRASEFRELVKGGGDGNGNRALALIDPRARRGTWALPTRSDGRRSPAPYRDYADFVRATEVRGRHARRTSKRDEPASPNVQDAA